MFSLILILSLFFTFIIFYLSQILKHLLTLNKSLHLYPWYTHEKYLQNFREKTFQASKLNGDYFNKKEIKSNKETYFYLPFEEIHCILQKETDVKIAFFENDGRFDAWLSC